MLTKTNEFGNIIEHAWERVKQIVKKKSIKKLKKVVDKGLKIWYYRQALSCAREIFEN